MSLADRPAGGADRLRILLVDDHPVVRDGLRGQLETQADLIVAAEAGSAEEALALLRSCRADVVLTDLRMPGMGGVELIRQVRRAHPDVAVVVLTTYDSPEDVGPALTAGACGYLLKDAHRSTIAEALRAARLGKRTISASVRPPSGSACQSGSAPAPLLSGRELDVLRLVAAGHTNAQIGAALHIGESTVKTHLQHIFAKLDTGDRASTVAVAYQRGLL